jgi:hypothetical protein
LAAPGRWPNLASRVLKLACERLSQDWQEHLVRYPVQVVETFVDPQCPPHPLPRSKDFVTGRGRVRKQEAIWIDL